MVMGPNALLSACLSVCTALEKIHISESLAGRSFSFSMRCNCVSIRELEGKSHKGQRFQTKAGGLSTMTSCFILHLEQHFKFSQKKICEELPKFEDSPQTNYQQLISEFLGWGVQELMHVYLGRIQ